MGSVPVLVRLRIVLVLAVILPLTGCLFRTRRVQPTASTATLRQATQAELVNSINQVAEKIKTLNATVDIDTDVGGAKKGKVTEYQQIRGYILVRKPGMLRMIGLFPVVRNRAFDMVSDGREFRLSIPVKNRFYEGRNDIIEPTAKNPLENLRPQHIMDALLLRPIDPANEIAVLEASTENVIDPKSHKPVEQADYEIVVVSRSGNGWLLSRRIVFSRTDLLPHRQIVYDKLGNVATDARYEGYKDFDGVQFPSQIMVNRPQEEYAITLSVVKLKINENITDEQFDLPVPPGAQVVRLDAPHAPMEASDGKGPKKSDQQQPQ